MRNRNKQSHRKQLAPTKACFRSAITTGSRLLNEVDGRSLVMRRLRDIIQAHQADLGGAGALSEGQTAILRRAALLQLQLEMMEQRFALRPDGSASVNEIETYQRSAGALRRLLESLGLHEGRKARAANAQPRDYRHLIEAARLG